MENINDWLIRTVRDDEKKGIMSGWIEEVRFALLPHMSRTIEHIINGGSLVVLTDRSREWFGDYIITHINQPHKGRPFFPIVQIKHLYEMIDANAKDGSTKGFTLIENMLQIMIPNYRFWYIGRKNIRADFATYNKKSWCFFLDEDNPMQIRSNDEKLDYKLLSLFKIFDRALLAAMLNKISLGI